jgi:predicted outer membrane repeat protein
LHLATIINNSFWNNTCDGGGGAIFSNKARPLIFNTIFYEDTDTAGIEIYLNFTTDTVDLAYSCIDQSLISGNLVDWGGNISADPGFQDDTCHISDLSTCEDAGAINVTIHGIVYPAPNDDFEGTFRPYHMGVDIGADECDIITSLPDQIITKAEVNCYPNPTEGISHFAFRISQYQDVTLKVYDTQGREMAVLFNGNLPGGEHTLSFDMSGLPAGIYFYRFAVGGQRSAVSGKIVKY